MKPLQLLDRYGFCPFCIAVQNYASFVQAEYKGAPAEVCPSRTMTNPVELTEWLHSMITENWLWFTLDANRYAFVPVAVVKQTPLCPMHLWMVTDPRQKGLLL